MQTFGILTDNKLITFKGCDTLQKLGSRLLRYKFKSEGIVFNSTGIIEYMQSWCEWSKDTEEPCEDPELMIDVAVGTLVYSNIHFINMDTRIQISNSDREIVEAAVFNILNKPFL